MLGTQSGTPFLLLSIVNYDTYQVRMGTRTGTQSGTRSGTAYIEKEGKERKEGAHARPLSQTGGVGSANQATEFFKLRKANEFSQLSDDEIWAKVEQQNGSAA
jgi:hypothetical protein